MSAVFSAHPALLSILGYWIFSAIVGGMPEPTPTSSVTYIWIRSSLHILAGNMSAAFASKYPQLAQLPSGSVQVTTTQEKTITAVPPDSKKE